MSPLKAVAFLLLAAVVNAAAPVPVAIQTTTAPQNGRTSNAAGVNVGHAFDSGWLAYMKRLGVNGAAQLYSGRWLRDRSSAARLLQREAQRPARRAPSS